MINEIINEINIKKIIILGFGREGRSTYKLLENISQAKIIHWRYPKIQEWWINKKLDNNIELNAAQAI